jgi:hypothetical protein
MQQPYLSPGAAGAGNTPVRAHHAKKTEDPGAGEDQAAATDRVTLTGLAKPEKLSRFSHLPPLMAKLARAAKEYVDIVTDFVPLVKTGKSLFSMGKKLMSYTPLGLVTTPLANVLGRTMEKMTDSAIDATGAMFYGASAFHASLYRQVLFPNLLGK